MNQIIRVFISEIEISCNIANHSISNLNEVLVDRYKFSNEFTVDRIFHSLFSYLHATSNISLSFWPAPRTSHPQYSEITERGQRMRELFEIKDSHPLKNKKFRHDIAHMDERIHEWYELSKNKNIARRIVGPKQAIGGLDDQEIFEHYDPSTKTFTFRGDTYNLQDSFDIVVELRSRAQVLLRSM